MEKIVKEFVYSFLGKKVKNEKEIILVRYVDYFVIFYLNLNVVIKVKVLVEEFFRGMGLEFKLEKICLIYIFIQVGEEELGFNFFGFNIC